MDCIVAPRKHKRPREFIANTANIAMVMNILSSNSFTVIDGTFDVDPCGAAWLLEA